MTKLSKRNKKAQLLLQGLYDDLSKTGASNLVGEVDDYLTDDIDPQWKAALANVMVHHHFEAQNYRDALVYCQKWLVFAPNNIAAVRGLISVLVRLRRWDEIINVATHHLAKHHLDYGLHSSLCQALARNGRMKEAREHGSRCLALKDKSVKAEAMDLSGVSVPSFNKSDRTRNIIAFSLYGSGEKYLRGAVTNVLAARFIYPQWTCRFYIDETVPRKIVQHLEREGAELRTVNGLANRKYGTFWRFLVADDPAVDRYLVRDCDSVVNVRERLAVEEWIDSGRHFHLMRDFYTHTELVLAGMWGGVTSALPPMGKAMTAYANEAIHNRTLDQTFLREVIWPTIRQSVLIHDSQFAFGDCSDFPRLARLPDGQHVGISL